MKSALSSLKKHISDPRKGLPEEVFSFVTTLTPMVNVDLLIKDDSGNILLTWRDDLGGGWHIPGSIIRVQETIRQRLQKTVEKELSCTAVFSDTPIEVKEFIFPELKERSHFISFLYETTLTSLPPNELHSKQGKPSAGQFRWFAQAPDDLLIYHNYYRKYFKKGL